MTGRWACRRCPEAETEDSVIRVGGGLRELHKITCLGCKATGTYSANLAAGKRPARSDEGQFRWRKEAA